MRRKIRSPWNCNITLLLASEVPLKIQKSAYGSLVILVRVSLSYMKAGSSQISSTSFSRRFHSSHCFPFSSGEGIGTG